MPSELSVNTRMKSMTIDMIEAERAHDIQDTEGSSNSHAASNDLLDDEKEGNQTVSEILSLLSSNEAKSNRGDATPSPSDAHRSDKY